MASRAIALGRIVDWFRTCDTEEGMFALVRGESILRDRKARMEETLLPGKQKRAARAKRPTNAQETAAQMGIPGTEKAISA